jgi:hypothetical protein
MIMITLTLVSTHSMTGRIYAIEQPSKMEGLNAEECDKIINCEIVSTNVLKYPDIVDPFGTSKDISITMMNNLNDSQKMAENTCQKLMDVDIVKTKDQQIGEKNPKYLICLP